MDEERFADILGCICMEDEEFWELERKHHFSPRYRRRKSETLWKYRQQKEGAAYGFLPLYPVRKRRMFVALVLLMILFMGIGITAKELRLKYYQNMEIQSLEDHAQFSMVVDVSETENLATVSNDAEREMGAYPQYVPDGYERSKGETQTSYGFRCIEYCDEWDDVIRFVQVYSLEDTGITTDGKEMTDVMVGDYEGFFIPDAGKNILLWSDGTYYYVVTGTISREELLRMAESVESVE